MKRCIVAAVAVVAGFACVARAAENMIGRQTQNEGLFATPAKGAVAIDGVFAPDEWDLSGQIQSYADSGVKDFYSVRTAAMWDADHLYLAFDWRDPMPLNSRVDPEQDPSRGWVADSIQLRVTAGGQSSWITMWGYDYANGIKPAFDVAYATAPRSFKERHPASKLYYTGKPGEVELGDGVALAYRMADDGKGFTQEVRIPWPILYLDDAAKGAAGESFRMGIEFLYGSASGTGFPVHRYIDNMQPGKTSREFFWTAFDSWGDVYLAESSVEPRKYVEGSLKPQGTIPLRTTVPADATFFTLAVNSADGTRVRNAAGGCRVEDFAVETLADGSIVVEALWDGKDEAGALVSPGTYTVTGIVSDKLDGYYETSFYNPGTPPWQTTDKTGAWGADHTVPHLVARSGDNLVICCTFAEGGYGTFVVHPDGTKAWSEVRGSDVLAATPDYVFTVPNDWGVSGAQILRMDAKTGAFAPFSADLPMPLPLGTLFGTEGGQTPRVVALAAAGDVFIVVSTDSRLRVFDAATSALRKEFPFALSGAAAPESASPDRTDLVEGGTTAALPFASDGSFAYAAVDGAIVRTDLSTGETAPLALGVQPGNPRALALDDAGFLYVADDGPRHQVLKFDLETGALAGTFGKEGGRARQGKFDRDGMRYLSSVAVAANGEVWVTEKSTHPRRVSVWSPDGTFARDFIGNTGYAGQGSLIHDDDPAKAVAEMNELVLDPATGKWDIESVMFNPDPEKGDFIAPGGTAFHSGNVFFSSASGEEREYFSCLGDTRNTPFFLMMKVGGDWQPVAAVASVARLQGLLGGQYGAQVVKDSFGAWADLDPATILVWNDYDNDGHVVREECELIPPVKPSRPQGGKNAGHNVAFNPCGNTTLDPDDLGFFATWNRDGKGVATVRVTPASFRDGGRPVYTLEGVKDYPCDFAISGAATPVPGKDLVIAFVQMNKRIYVVGFRKSDGTVLWRHLSPYHQVHGSHNATMPRPGLLIGCLKVCGVAEDCGDSDVFMIRGNLGEDYFLTTDGHFVNILTKDGRIPGIALPEDETTLRATSFAALQGRGEHFSGVFTKHRDGVIRCSGAVPASQAGNIVRIEGLDSIRHLDPFTITLSDADIVKADEDNTRRALEASKAESAPLSIARAQLDGNGNIQWNKVPAIPIQSEGQPAQASFRAAYDAGQLALRWDLQRDSSPWKNGGNDWHLLFKTGDCFDFQLSPTGNRGANPANGDFRLLVAPFQGGNAVVLMKQRAEGAPAGQAFNYTSPVMTVRFDSVTLLADVEPEVKVGDDRVTVTVAVPWTALGMVAPAAGSTLSGDVGFILSDSSGTFNTARVYRANKATGLVNDQPSEASIRPQLFSDVVFE
ncbi:MAG: hypothetical protein ACOX5G_08895 [Kiritimatiellia bacterium]|jgi:DNA-binding beta-propeller fold protein YncE